MWQQEYKSFEGLSEKEKVDRLKGILERECQFLGTKKSRAGVTNHHYLSRDGKYVTTIIYNKDDKALACVYDHSSYEKYFKEGGLVLSLNDRGEGKCYDPVINGKEFPFNVKAHRVILTDDPSGKLPEGYEVDHITHTHSDMTREGLRICTRVENGMNKAFRSHMDGGTLTCRVKEISDAKAGELTKQGYLVKKVKGGYKVMKKGCREARAEMEAMEETLFGEFRYNPLMCFSETWHALILWKMIGIPEDEVMAYQKGYLTENCADICKHYGLSFS